MKKPKLKDVAELLACSAAGMTIYHLVLKPIEKSVVKHWKNRKNAEEYQDILDEESMFNQEVKD